MRRWMVIGLIFILPFLGSCGEGGGGTGVANPPSSEKAAAAISALFGSNTTASASVKYAIKVAEIDEGRGFECPNDPYCTCTFVLSGEEDGEHGITDGSYGSPGVYGSVGHSITVTEDHFCTQADGDENTGAGPDGLGRFATFELTRVIEGSCVDASNETSVLTMGIGSTGIWRNTNAQEDGTPAYFPQIYGRFIFTIDNVEAIFYCTIYLNENETAVFADCSDENGNAVSQDTEAICNFSED